MSKDEKTDKWFSEMRMNQEEFYARYPDKILGIIAGEVIIVADDMPAFLIELHKLPKDACPLVIHMCKPSDPGIPHIYSVDAVRDEMKAVELT